jgi:geranylgeranyl diphosphate synthase type II
MEEYDFNSKYKYYQDLVNLNLDKYLIRGKSPEKKLRESMEYSLMAGGKRIRPILMLSTYMMFCDDYENAIPFAVAMEMIHNFSLIHDDLPVIDDDDYRHSKLTNHKVFGESTAMLAGDALLNYAYIIISNELLKKDYNLESKIKCFSELSNAIDRMIAGEYVDTFYEGKFVNQEMLEYMHKNKTGAFIEASVKIGAILANAKEDDIEKLANYAKNIGLAFQIKDDILSETGTFEKLGKPIGNDAKMRKSTYVTNFGLEKSQEILENITNEAIKIMDLFGDKGRFLKDLAIYIKDREK